MSSVWAGMQLCAAEGKRGDWTESGFFGSPTIAASHALLACIASYTTNTCVRIVVHMTTKVIADQNFASSEPVTGGTTCLRSAQIHFHCCLPLCNRLPECINRGCQQAVLKRFTTIQRSAILHLQQEIPRCMLTRLCLQLILQHWQQC